MKKTLSLVACCCLPAIAGAMPPFATDLDLGIDAVLERLERGSQGKTPTVKKFDRAWVASLFERGEPTVYGAEGFDYIGMPVGGLTCGQLYLGGDGKLWHWDIFNTRRPSRVAGAYRYPTRQNSPIEQGFAIRVTSAGRSVTRSLDRRGFRDIKFCGQYPIGYVTYEDPDLPVKVSLEAFSPFIPLDLDDSSFPATILEFTVKNTSATPVSAAVAGWLENAVCKAKASGLAGERVNEIVSAASATFLQATARRVKSPEPEAARQDVPFEDFESGTYAAWTVEGDAFGKPGEPLRRYFHHEPLRGFQGKHLADSFRNAGRAGAEAGASDGARGKLTSKPFKIERRWVRFRIGGGRHKDTSIRLLVGGKVARTASGDNSETLVPKGWNVASLQGKEAVIEIVDDNTGGWGHVLVDEIIFSDKRPEAAAPLEKHPDFGSMGLAILASAKETLGACAVNVGETPEPVFQALSANAGTSPPPAAARPLGERLVGALGREISLEPGESGTVRFVVTWFFPRSRVRGLKTDTTRWYSGRFDSARDVAAAIVRDFESLAAQTRLWKQTWYDSTLPYWFLDRTFLNTSILASETCYRFRDGRFYADEGVYCCAGTCTHVWGYVQATGRLFPELEKALRERVDYKEGVAFYPQSGAISYRGDIYHGPQTAVDGQSGVILRTLREHQMSADDSFLRRVYPAAKKAMNYLVNTYDANEDGILEGAQHNTLDAAWYGKITWLSLYYCAALRAMEQMALDMGDADYAKRVRTLAERGGRNIAAELFNGEYFIQKADPRHPDSPGVFNGCEYSQLLGQGWAYQVGLGHITDNRKVRTALHSLWRYNFTTDVGPFRKKYPNGRWYAMPGEGGLIACTFPRGGEDVLSRGNRTFAGYLNECQNGYEYGATSLMMWEGMVDYALAHTRALHDRYHASRRNPWNEVECGEHYARSMASYGLFTAICGFEVYGPKRYIAFSPRLHPENFRAAFTAPEGWGTFQQRREGSLQEERLEVRWGKLRLEQMAFDLAAGSRASSVRVNVGKAKIPASFRTVKNRVVVLLEREVTIEAGGSLRVVVVSGEPAAKTYPPR